MNMNMKKIFLDSVDIDTEINDLSKIEDMLSKFRDVGATHFSIQTNTNFDREVTGFQFDAWIEVSNLKTALPMSADEDEYEALNTFLNSLKKTTNKGRK